MNTSIDEPRIGETTFQSDAFFRSGQKTGKINPTTDPVLLDHITTNADRNDAIMNSIAEQSLTEPAQIDAYLAGNRTALLEGAL